MKRLVLGVALATLSAALAMLVLPQQASALSLLSPGIVAGTQSASDSTVTKVRWDGRRGWGRGHFRGHRRWHGHRGWHRRHFGWRPRYFAPRYHYGPVSRCRVVWTYYGPQRICRIRYR